MAAILFAVYSLLSGVQQGIIVWLFREYVPPTKGEWINAALHTIGALIYAAVVGYTIYVGGDALRLAGIAVLLRIALFDVFLNLGRSWFSHREGRAWEPLFAVGSSALADRAINAVAKLLRLNPSVLSAILRVAALAAAIWLALQK